VVQIVAGLLAAGGVGLAGRDRDRRLRLFTGIAVIALVVVAPVAIAAQNGLRVISPLVFAPTLVYLSPLALGLLGVRPRWVLLIVGVMAAETIAAGLVCGSEDVRRGLASLPVKALYLFALFGAGRIVHRLLRGRKREPGDAPRPRTVESRRTLERQLDQATLRPVIVVALAVVAVSLLGAQYFGLPTDLPWQAFRASLLLLAVPIILSGPRRYAVVAVVVWAFVAGPLAVAPRLEPPRASVGEKVGVVRRVMTPLGDRYPLLPTPAQRREIQRIIKRREGYQGPHVLYAGPIPIGLVQATTPETRSVILDGGGEQTELVAWSLVWLPWPHVDETHVAILGGGSWFFGDAQSLIELARDDVAVHRHGRRLLVRGWAGATLPPERDPYQPRLGGNRRVVIGLSVGAGTFLWLTVAGWAAVLTALGMRVFSSPRGNERE